MPPKRPAPVASSSRLPAGGPASKRARAASELSSGDESSFHSGSQAASGSEASDDYSSEDEGSQGSLVAGIESDSASEAEEHGGRSERLSDKEKLRRWRRVGAEEREAVCSEGGAVWACARPIFALLPRNHRASASAILSRSLTRLDGALERLLVPPTKPLPAGTAGTSGVGGTASTAGSMVRWRAEREAGMGLEEEMEVERGLLGEGGDEAMLESLLLPEALETVALAATLRSQAQELEALQERVERLRRRAEDAGEAPTLRLPHVEGGELSVAQDAAIVGRIKLERERRRKPNASIFRNAAR